MNKILLNLKEKADNTEIPNLSKNIISKVDTSKVIIKPEKVRQPWRWAIPTLSAVCCSLLVLLMLAIALKPSSKVKNIDSNIINPVDPDTGEVDVTESLINDTYAYQVYSLTNIAASLTNNINASISKFTVEEEQAIVDDLDDYIDNLEEMLGLAEMNYTVTDNLNELYAYEKVMTVTGDNSGYCLFYTEEIVGTKNEGKANYKLDSNLLGIVILNGAEYNISGTKRCELDSVEFQMKIEISTNEYIILTEEMDATENNYEYEYFKNGNSEKLISIDEKATEIDFRNGSVKCVISKKNVKTNVSDDILYSFDCKIKSSDGDYVYVIKTNDYYQYTFKNSENNYQK